MSESTSVCGRSVYPVLGYRDAHAAIAFLKVAFGFEEWMVVPNGNGGVMHAELALGDGVVLLHSLAPGAAGWPPGSADPAVNPVALYVVVPDIDAHCARAKAARAVIEKEPFDTDYGSRDYTARDPEGHIWYFGTYNPCRPAT
jgi:uncharacterized glyoxalase superfamily protein PhnB